MHARGHHAIDVAQGLRQLLRHRIDVAHALFGRRGHQALLLEHLAHAGIALGRQALRAQHLERAAHAALFDLDLPAAAFEAVLRGVDAFGRQGGDDLVGFLLVEVGIERDLAAREHEQHGDGREPAKAVHCWFFSRVPNRLVAALARPVEMCILANIMCASIEWSVMTNMVLMGSDMSIDSSMLLRMSS